MRSATGFDRTPPPCVIPSVLAVAAWRDATDAARDSARGVRDCYRARPVNSESRLPGSETTPGTPLARDRDPALGDRGVFQPGRLPPPPAELPAFPGESRRPPGHGGDWLRRTLRARRWRRRHPDPAPAWRRDVAEGGAPQYRGGVRAPVVRQDCLDRLRCRLRAPRLGRGGIRAPRPPSDGAALHLGPLPAGRPHRRRAPTGSGISLPARDCLALGRRSFTAFEGRVRLCSASAPPAWHGRHGAR